MKSRVCLYLVVSTSLAIGETTRIESRDGRVIEVTVLGVQNGSVNVKKADGKEFKIPLANLTEESVKRINQESKSAIPIDGGLPEVKVQTESVTPAEAKLFTELYPLLKESRYQTLIKPNADETLKLRANCDAILASLDKIHGKLATKDRCERLLAVASGSLQGSAIAVRLGAASCLAQIQGSEATACLFKGLNSNLPEAAEMECQRGLGERCTGKVLDQLLEMFMSSDTKTRGQGGFALTYITTKAQLAELKERAKTVVNTAESQDRLNAVFVLTRNVKD